MLITLHRRSCAVLLVCAITLAATAQAKTVRHTNERHEPAEARFDAVLAIQASRSFSAASGYRA